MNYKISPCDKCGLPVPMNNSALALEDVCAGGFAGFFRNRHLYPTPNCEGSPSRVARIENDADWKLAYFKLQKLANETGEAE